MEEILNVIKQMVKDGCISQEAAEKYCPEIKKYKDEIVKNQILELIKQHSVNSDRCNMENWVYSHAQSYKPSIEQMEALSYYTKYCVDKDGVFGSQLVKLYQDLLKLKGLKK
jgi:polyhydroxyalkanoate synthesis regulator phasin